jgi:hypothetical protein
MSDVWWRHMSHTAQPILVDDVGGLYVGGLCVQFGQFPVCFVRLPLAVLHLLRIADPARSGRQSRIHVAAVSIRRIVTIRSNAVHSGAPR